MSVTYDRAKFGKVVVSKTDAALLFRRENPNLIVRRVNKFKADLVHGTVILEVEVENRLSAPVRDQDESA